MRMSYNLTTYFLASVASTGILLSVSGCSNSDGGTALPAGSTGGAPISGVGGGGGAVVPGLGGAAGAPQGLGGTPSGVTTTPGVGVGGTPSQTTPVVGAGGSPVTQTTAASAGGTTAQGGATSTDPCAKTPCTVATCTPVKPTSALLTDFSSNSGKFQSSAVEWWKEFFGGTYVYPKLDLCAATQPPTTLSEEFTAGSWHILGTVGDYSGFGMYFAPCVVDMSAYRGVSFTISGNAGAAGTVKLTVATAGNTKLEADNCMSNTATCTAANCVPGGKDITVSATPTTVTVLWADLLGGAPETAINAAQITGLAFAATWDWAWTTGGGGVPTEHQYPIDIVVDDVTLVQ